MHPDIGVSGAGTHLVPARLHSRGNQTIPTGRVSLARLILPMRVAQDIGYGIALAEGDLPQETATMMPHGLIN